MRLDPAVFERPLLPLFSLLDVHQRLLLHRSGRLTLVYRLDAFHEPALDDPEFEHLAEQLTHAWSALPERVSYQFLTLVDAAGVTGVLDEVFRPVPELSARHRLYEAVRCSVLQRFQGQALGDDAGRDLLQARQHFLAVTFLPQALQRQSRAHLPLVGRQRQAQSGRAWDAALGEADLLDRSVTRVLRELGVGHERCDDDGIARLLHAQLSPTTASERPLEQLGARRHEHDRLPESLLAVYPFLADAAPLWDVTDDALRVERDHLRLGDWCVGAVTMKRLPDQTHAGSLVPLLRLALLRLALPRYLISFRVNVLDQAQEVAALAAAPKDCDMCMIRLRTCAVGFKVIQLPPSVPQPRTNVAVTAGIAVSPAVLIVPGVLFRAEWLLAAGVFVAAVAVFFITPQIAMARLAIVLLFAQMATGAFTVLLPWRRDWRSLVLVATGVTILAVLAAIGADDLSLLRSIVRGSAIIALVVGITTLSFPLSARAVQKQLYNLDVVLSRWLGEGAKTENGMTDSTHRPLPSPRGWRDAQRLSTPEPARPTSIVTAPLSPPTIDAFAPVAALATTNPSIVVVELECNRHLARAIRAATFDVRIHRNCETEWVGIIDACLNVIGLNDTAEIRVQKVDGTRLKDSRWMPLSEWSRGLVSDVGRVKFRKAANDGVVARLSAMACSP